MPNYVKKFIEESVFETDYFYIIITYGMHDGGVAERTKNFMDSIGKRADYINTIKMHDNAIIVFDMDQQRTVEESKKRLYLTDVGFFPYAEKHYRERKDGIEEYIFIYCTEGSGTIYVDNKKYIIHENEAFCIPRYRAHRYFANENDPWSILWVHFKGEDVVYFPVEECRIVQFDSQHATNRMHFLFDLLFRVLNGNYSLGNFIYISQVLSLILAETYDRQKKSTDQEQNKHVSSVIRYFSKHLDENLTLEEICREFELSKSYLNVIFQKYTQHAPMDFFINMKMKKACQMLKSGDLYIYEIAQRVGYSDQYYFSRIFKRVVGVSPKEYRQSDYYHYKE